MVVYKKSHDGKVNITGAIYTHATDEETFAVFSDDIAVPDGWELSSLSELANAGGTLPKQKLVQLEEQNLIIMSALANVYAETLGDKADEQTLVDLYTPLVEAGRKTIEQVPEKARNAVQDRVSAKGDGGVKDAN